MLVCRFCGCPIKPNRFHCDHCGRAITDIHAFEKEDKYGKYDSSKDTSISGNNRKKRKKGSRGFFWYFSELLWKVGFLAVLVLPVYFGYFKIRNFFRISYQATVYQAVRAEIEQNFEMKMHCSVVNYEDLMVDYYDDLYLGMKQIFQQDMDSAVRELKQTYGEKYKIKVDIHNVEEMSGALRRQALFRMIHAFNKDLEKQGILLDCRQYMKVGKMKKIQRVQVTAVIEGSEKKETRKYEVDLVKLEDRRNWKVLYVYPIK